MHRNDVVCFVPLAALAVIVVLPFEIVAELRSFAPRYKLIVLEVSMLCAAILAGASVTIVFVIHAVRRVDFGPTQKAAWIAILLAAGPLGPPAYWFGVTRAPAGGSRGGPGPV